LRVTQSEGPSGSNTEATKLDAATELQAWKEVVGGKSRCRVYGTGDMVGNYHQGVSSLTQPLSFTFAGDFPVQTEKEKRMAREIVKIKQEARTTTEKVHQLEDDLRMVKEQLADDGVAMR